jgi:hypothetical protein
MWTWVQFWIWFYIEIGGGTFQNLLWDVPDVDEPGFCPLQIISNTMVSTCMHVMLLRNCWDGPYLLFTIISVTVQNRTHVHKNFLLRITHIISQSIADSSWVTLYVLLKQWNSIYIYIYITKHRSAEPATFWGLITANNNIHIKTGNVRT